MLKSSVRPVCAFSASACAGISWPKNSRRGLGPADGVHALVQILHQLGQIGQEGLALRRRGLGLHAHEQLAAGVAQARTRSLVPPSRGGRLQQHLAPDRGLTKSRRKAGAATSCSSPSSCCAYSGAAAARLRAAAAARWRRLLGLDRGPGLLGDEGLERRASRVLVGLDLVEVALDDLLHQVAHLGQEGLRACSSLKSSKPLPSEAMRLMNWRTGCLRDEKKLGSPSAARSTGSCSRAIWRAICGGTLGSDRIWSNRLPMTSITM
jgi:hypothetical protein